MTTMRPPGPFDAKLAVEVEDGISYPFSDGKLRLDSGILRELLARTNSGH